MAKIKAFKGIRPTIGLEKDVAELPYDVVNAAEAKEMAGDNQNSFFHITRPEIGLAEDISPYDESVYQKGKENLERFIQQQILKQDKEDCLYVYTLEMNGRKQTGLVACVSIDDYENNVVKKHEFTREDKEKDRTTHLNILNANTGPVFLLYKEDGSNKPHFDIAKEIQPDYDFYSDSGIKHTVRVVKDKELIESFVQGLKNKDLYIADGHHRAASAAMVGKMRREQNPDLPETAESGYFLSVIFPHDELKILAYNRAVKDLNGLSKEEFMTALDAKFTITKTSDKEPAALHSFSMYIDNEWYDLKPEFEIPMDPINSLDVKILQDNVLSKILGIDDPRTSKQIDFIGGIRGTKELEKIVDAGDYKVAFSMYPTTIEQLIDVSDSGNVMPPKSTWFEPKLMSGLLVHSLE